MSCMRRWLLLLGLTGCGEAAGVCAQVEVAAGLQVAVHDAMGTREHPRPGAYTFTVTTEFGVLTWMCTIAAGDDVGSGCAGDYVQEGEVGESSGDGSSGAGGSSGGDDDAVAVLLVSAVAGEDEFWLALTRLESNLWTGPDEARVEIERDGELVADETFMPKYEYSQLSGGRGCPQYWVLKGAAPTIGL